MWYINNCKNHPWMIYGVSSLNHKSLGPHHLPQPMLFNWPWWPETWDHGSPPPSTISIWVWWPFLHLSTWTWTPTTFMSQHFALEHMSMDPHSLLQPTCECIDLFTTKHMSMDPQHNLQPINEHDDHLHLRDPTAPQWHFLYVVTFLYWKHLAWRQLWSVPTTWQKSIKTLLSMNLTPFKQIR